MDDFEFQYKSTLDLKRRRDERQKELSKARLLDVSKKKIQTTMIGSLSTIEKHFGFLWEGDGLSEDQMEMKAIFDEIRSEILDRGNTQIRNLENEFTHYDIVWKKYTINLPFKNKGE